MKTQQDDKQEWAGRRAGVTQRHSIRKAEERRPFQKNKSVMNVSSKIRTEQHPLDLTALRSSVSNLSGVSRKQSPD